MDLTYKRTNVYAAADKAELVAIMAYAEGYKRYLDSAKTEREAVSATVKMLEEAGYKPYTLGDKIFKGEERRDALVTDAAADVMAQPPELAEMEPETVEREITAEEAATLLGR